MTTWSMADTVQRPGGDAAVVRIHGTNKGLAATCDVTPRYCKADPFEGGKQAVAESWRNLTATGAEPLAITDCLNFGNPERPEIMGEFVGCIQGMAEACRALAFPVVSGNVSLYNETNGVAIPPTPAIGAIGLIPDLDRQATIALRPDQTILLIGGEGSHLGQSLYQAVTTGGFAGAPPAVDLDAERRNGDFVRALIREALCSTAHDISDGGLLVALAEMALAGNTGFTLYRHPGALPLARPLFRRGPGPLCAGRFPGGCRCYSGACAARRCLRSDCRRCRRRPHRPSRRGSRSAQRPPGRARGLVPPVLRNELRVEQPRSRGRTSCR